MKTILLSAILSLVLASLNPATAQSTADKLAKLFEVSGQLRNPGATDRLLVLRRELPLLVRPIIVLGRQAKTKTDAKALEPDALDYLVEVFRNLGSQLLEDPAAAIAAVDEAGGAETKLSAEDQELAAALDRSFHLKIAETAIARFAERGAFDGMFSDLFGERPRLARAFLDLFLDRLRPTGIRAYASQGAAEVASASQHAEFAKDAARILQQVDEEDYILRSALVLMKRCGRHLEFDAKITALELEVTKELAKVQGERQLPLLLENYEALVDLLGRAGNLKQALAYDEAYCRLLLGNCNFETQTPEARIGIAAALYDFACRLSRSQSLAAASQVLDLAISWGYRNLDWLANDPELQAWRAVDQNQEKLVAFRAGNPALGSCSFDPALWDQVVHAAVKAYLSAKPQPSQD